jgi:hypothetical protein
MNIELNQDYTIIALNGMAMTIKHCFNVLDFKEGTGYEKRHFEITFKEKGKRKARVFSPEMKHTLIFKGSNIPFKVDSDFNHFQGNALINLVSDNAEMVKKYIEEMNLNPAVEKYRIVMWKLEGDDYNQDEKTLTILYKDLAVKEGHAVMNRYLEEQGTTEHAMCQADIDRLNNPNSSEDLD